MRKRCTYGRGPLELRLRDGSPCPANVVNPSSSLLAEGDVEADALVSDGRGIDVDSPNLASHLHVGSVTGEHTNAIHVPVGVLVAVALDAQIVGDDGVHPSGDRRHFDAGKRGGIGGDVDVGGLGRDCAAHRRAEFVQRAGREFHKVLSCMETHDVVAAREIDASFDMRAFEKWLACGTTGEIVQDRSGGSSFRGHDAVASDPTGVTDLATASREEACAVQLDAVRPDDPDFSRYGLHVRINRCQFLTRASTVRRKLHGHSVSGERNHSAITRCAVMVGQGFEGTVGNVPIMGRDADVELDVIVQSGNSSNSGPLRRGGLVCEVRSARHGTSSSPLRMPFEPLEAEAHLLRLSREQPRRLEQSPSRAMRTFGTQLFSALFTGQAGRVYAAALDEARTASVPLRIRLRVVEPEARSLPWEYLFDASNDVRLAMSSSTSLVRACPGPLSDPVDFGDHPMRILAMICSPTDTSPIQADRERKVLEEKLRPYCDAGQATLTFTVNGTMEALRAAVTAYDIDVLYFVGHGEYDERNDDGLLVLESTSGRAHVVPGREVGVLLEGRGIQVAVVNACEGARQSIVDPFAGVSAALIGKGLRATVSMQYEIESDAAVAFGPVFVEELVRCRDIEAAMVAARQAVFARPHSTVEWGTPVLHVAAPREDFNLATSLSASQDVARAPSVRRRFGLSAAVGAATVGAAWLCDTFLFSLLG